MLTTSNTLLIIDDDANVLATMSRIFRHDDYELLLANGGAEGLERLASHEVGVILADQHMRDMTGVAFLSRARELRPDSVRIVLTGYTDISSVTDAVNHGAIYKFLTKPWDDDDLRKAVREAFLLHRVTRENTRLTGELQEANTSLTRWNLELEQRVAAKTHEALLNLQTLRVSQEILEYLPVAVLGIDPSGQIVISNRAAEELLGGENPLVGEMAREILPEKLSTEIGQDAETMATQDTAVLRNGQHIRYWCHAMGKASNAAGLTLVFYPLTLDVPQ